MEPNDPQLRDLLREWQAPGISPAVEERILGPRRSWSSFLLHDPNGKPISLTNYKGKVVVVQFLITNCSHCQALSRLLTKLQTEYGPLGFQAFGVAINDATPEMVRGYVRDHELSIPVGSAPRDQVVKYLGVSEVERLAVPQVMIIDRRGVIEAQSEAQGTPDLQDETFLRGLIGDLLKR
jgi:peroxiredoxin